jgi:hypothetical protein
MAGQVDGGVQGAGLGEVNPILIGIPKGNRRAGGGANGGRLADALEGEDVMTQTLQEGSQGGADQT